MSKLYHYVFNPPENKNYFAWINHSTTNKKLINSLNHFAFVCYIYKLPQEIINYIIELVFTNKLIYSTQMKKKWLY